MPYAVARCRELAGMSQAELASRLGISQQSVAYYEKPDGDLKVSVALRIAEALGTTIDALLGLDDAAPPVIIGEMVSGDEMELLGHFRALPMRERDRALGYIERMSEEYAQRGSEAVPEGDSRRTA